MTARSGHKLWQRLKDGRRRSDCGVRRVVVCCGLAAIGGGVEDVEAGG